MTPSCIGKRKRDNNDTKPPRQYRSTVIQIIVGSYERVLHGFTAVLVPNADKPPHEAFQDVTFTDSFLFNAHTSSIRCLALSPPSSSSYQNPSSKRILATGGTDEPINLYQLSACSRPPDTYSLKPLPTAPWRNHELGSLLHHSSSVSTLTFASRGKLLSASTDNSIAITRVRDWTVLSTIKAPVPKPAGRPSGDTAAAGEVPAGVNDIAVHPSAKLMLSVGQGERCMRLWNLVTGKKAGVLMFSREALAAVSEGRWRGGEGRSVVWDGAGEEFAVAFDKGVVIYGLDCEVKGVVRPVPATKVHAVRYLPIPDKNENEAGGKGEKKKSSNVLAMSTEDGRILFYDTSSIAPAAVAVQDDRTPQPIPKKTNASLPHCNLLGQLGGRNHGIITRIKDFEILTQHSSPPQMIKAYSSVEHRHQTNTSTRRITRSPTLTIITASSDGAIRLWNLDPSDLNPTCTIPSNTNQTEASVPAPAPKIDNAITNGTMASTTASPNVQTTVRQVGSLLGTHETGRRIMCLAAFVMDDPAPRSTSRGEDEEAEGGSFDADLDHGDGESVDIDGNDGETVGGAIANGDGDSHGGTDGGEGDEWGGLDEE